MNVIAAKLIAAVTGATEAASQTAVAVLKAAEVSFAETPAWTPADGTRRIQAIKRYRNEAGVTLLEAKNAVVEAHADWMTAFKAGIAADAYFRRDLAALIEEAERAEGAHRIDPLFPADNPDF